MHSIHSTEYVFGRRKRIIIVLYVFYKVILCVSPGKQMTELQLPFSVPPPKNKIFSSLLVLQTSFTPRVSKAENGGLQHFCDSHVGMLQGGRHVWVT